MNLENVVFPEEAITNIPVKIIVDENVSVKYEKNDIIIELVKERGYRWDYWNKTWVKQITSETGTAAERAAEIGNKLLNAGFPIMIEDKSIRNNAINGIFEPEQTRWIDLAHGNYAGRLILTWTEQDESLYKKARSLPRTRWDKGVVVKTEYYKEVEDFASMYGFEFTTAARQAIEDYKEQLANATRVRPVKVDDIKPADGLKAILEGGNEIIPDLMDC